MRNEVALVKRVEFYFPIEQSLQYSAEEDMLSAKIPHRVFQKTKENRGALR